MPAIKATNSKNLTVKDCIFSGFDTDIELENVEGFISENNNFSKNNDPRILLRNLAQEINNSVLDKCSKERLEKQIIGVLSSKNILKEKQDKIKNMLKYVGDKAVDLFIQVNAAVMAGLVIKNN